MSAPPKCVEAHTPITIEAKAEKEKKSKQLKPNHGRELTG